MHTHSKFILATLAATMLLAIAASGATARNLSVSERNFELIWNEALGLPKTKLEFISSGVNVQCRVTLLGRFNETTILKETTEDQGTINHGELESCTGGTATIRSETMPWGLLYHSFGGTLPRISSVTVGLTWAHFRIREPNGIECDEVTEPGHPAVFIAGNSSEATETGFERTGEPSNVTADRAARTLMRGEFICEEFIREGELGGIGLIRNLPRRALLRITLI